MKDNAFDDFKANICLRSIHMGLGESCLKRLIGAYENLVREKEPVVERGVI